MITQAKSKRKKTGGKLWRGKKKKHQMGRVTLFTGLDENLRKKKIRVRGRNQKIRLMSTPLVNVIDKKTGKCKLVKIKTVLQNPANPHYVRRNIMNKGAVIETELGKAKITSRAGQDGIVNAVLLEEK